MNWRGVVAAWVMVAVVPVAGAAGNGDAEVLPPLAVNSAMTDIGAIMSQLVDDKVQRSPKALAQQLDKLEERFRGMGAHVEERGPAFRITWQTMLEQIALTRQAVAGGNAPADTVNNLVHGIESTCSGCHLQDDRARTLSFGKLSTGGDLLTQARFAFITRDYAAALQLSDAWLDAQPRLVYTGQSLEALEAQLTLFAQVWRDAERGAGHFRARLARSGGSMSPQVKRDLEDWVAGLESIRKGNLIAFTPTFMQLESYAQARILPHAEAPLAISEQDKVAYLWLRGLMHEYVQAHPSDPHMPELLYWLALTERVLDYNVYYSLAELYLRECVIRFPATDAAQACLTEYERYIEASYSGSAGVYIPPSVEEDLARLKDLVEAARKAGKD